MAITGVNGAYKLTADNDNLTDVAGYKINKIIAFETGGVSSLTFTLKAGGTGGDEIFYSSALQGGMDSEDYYGACFKDLWLDLAGSGTGHLLIIVA